jgi:hypothetical protein
VPLKYCVVLQGPTDIKDGIAHARWRMTARWSSMLWSIAASSPCRPRSRRKWPRGFSLYMMKAILNEQADEVIDLALTNLWR